jgi:hypothetical protein
MTTEASFVRLCWSSPSEHCLARPHYGFLCEPRFVEFMRLAGWVLEPVRVCMVAGAPLSRDVKAVCRNCWPIVNALDREIADAELAWAVPMTAGVDVARL